MNVTLWETLSDVRKELSIQDDRTESDNRIEVTLLIGIAENNLPHIVRWESTKPPYAEPHVRWCGRSVSVKIGGKCLLWLALTSYPIIFPQILFSRCLFFVPQISQMAQIFFAFFLCPADKINEEPYHLSSDRIGQFVFYFLEYLLMGDRTFLYNCWICWINA